MNHVTKQTAYGMSNGLTAASRNQLAASNRSNGGHCQPISFRDEQLIQHSGDCSLVIGAARGWWLVG